MAEFIEVEHKDVEATALVPKTSLEHHAKAGWKPVPKSKSEVNAAAAENKES